MWNYFVQKVPYLYAHYYYFMNKCMKRILQYMRYLHTIGCVPMHIKRFGAIRDGRE